MKSGFKTSVITISLAIASSATAAPINGPMAFEPLTASASLISDAEILNTHPWEIPAGFSQHIVADESALDIYKGNDWHDMNTVNETQKGAGRYLYRTHEVRPGSDARNDNKVGGAVSAVDMKTGIAKELATRQDWEAIDGIVWTPWHTLLVTEEANTVAYPDPDYPNAVSGLVYEIKLADNDPMTATSVTVRPALGALAHEGIETDAEGNVYVIDEDYFGSIYKFVPNSYGDLSSGKLYALKLTTDNGDRTGPAEWVELNVDPVTLDAQAAANIAGATTWCRPEDLEYIANTLYVALTCDKDSSSGQRLENRVLSISLNDTPEVHNFVKAGVNVPVENGINPAGFAKPDNLANGPDGKLWIVEDNKPSDIWVAEPDLNNDGLSDGVHLFASLKDAEAEGTGIYFGKDPHTLFVNIQHSVTENDKSLAITKD